MELTPEQRAYIKSRKWRGHNSRNLIHIYGVGSHYITINYNDRREFVPIHEFRRRFVIAET